MHHCFEIAPRKAKAGLRCTNCLNHAALSKCVLLFLIWFYRNMWYQLCLIHVYFQYTPLNNKYLAQAKPQFQTQN